MATTATLERPAATAHLAVDVDALEEWFTARGVTGPAACAAFLGVDPSYLWRIKTGRRQPGPEFVAKVILETPPAERGEVFVTLFEPRAAGEVAA